MERVGIVGLALATALGFTALAAVLFELNRRELGGLGGTALRSSFVRATIGAVVMSAAIWMVGQFIHNTFLFLAAGVLVGAVVYLSVIWLLGGRELAALWRIARSGNAAIEP